VTIEAQMTDDEVARFLRANPDFFQRFPGLLALLDLPHESGKAVSLVERQVSILRERNIDMRRRFTQLVGAASNNDTLFDKTRTLTLALLDAEDFSQLDAAIEKSLKAGFKADAVACFITHPRRPPAQRHIQYRATARELPMLHLTQSTGTACGPLRSSEFRRLFEATDDAREASAAIVQLRHDDLVGVFAIGSRDPRRFSADMGTLFVRYIGDVLARVLVRLLATDGHD
jgi:uncharacterized protein YigA (DUF484 family)